MAVKLAKPINYRSAANITALDFQNIMQDLKVRKNFAVAVSGGPDSLALVLLSEICAQGDINTILQNKNSITAKYLSGKRKIQQIIRWNYWHQLKL